MALSVTQIIIRGATVQFSTTFYTVDDEPVNPNNATVNLAYETSAGVQTSAQVPMTAPSGDGFTWTALWDTRNVQAPRMVQWSIHTGTGDPIPVTAEDGEFMLSANAANLASF